MRKPILILLMSLITLIGCSRVVVIHPLTGKDIYDGKNVGDKCFSPYYLKEVMKVKIDAIK
jgi:hypothetical protein